MSSLLIAVAAWQLLGSVSAIYAYGRMGKPGRAFSVALAGLTCISILLVAAFGGVTP